jgi:putative chitinase
LRLAHFLAQCAHESGGFKRVSENLNYSADRLRQVFPTRFPDNATANAYAHNQQKIGSRIYAHKIGNADEASGDGFKFRGRGYIQLTGRANYHEFAQFIGENTEQNPDLVSNKYPLASAAFFFDTHGIWSICDQGSSDGIVKRVTRCVNGPACLGLNERIKYFKIYYALLT